MSLAVPTTQDIADNIVSQLEGQLSQTIPLLPKAFTRVLAKVLAAVFVLLYKYAGFILLQQFVRHATMAETTVNGKVIRPLVEWGRTIDVPDPEPALRTEFMVLVTVLTQVGSIRAGTKLINPTTGVVYKVLADVALNDTFVFPRVVACSDPSGGDGSGTLGNVQQGDSIEFASPVPNVNRTVIVSLVIDSGEDAESVDSYRARVLQKFQKRPQGGAYADYQQWGEEVAGIVAVYPYASNDPGVIDLYVEATPESSGSPDGIATVGQRNAVIDSCNLNVEGRASRRPVNAALRAFPIARTGFDLVVSGLELNDPGRLAAVQDSIEQAVDEYLRSREPYIVGLSVPPRRDRITRAAVSGIVDTIVSTELGAVTSVEVQLTGDDVAAHALEPGQKAKLGDVSYV
jgi:uncharacterized phage protein gp47/JayE